MTEQQKTEKVSRDDLAKALRVARAAITRMKRETNEFDEARAIANKAQRRIKEILGGRHV
ncbi:hypothetical protein [Ferrovibrio sp.]|uniref:hypothetical protein n=1 Tax=Ferrovibrio sp. TaxID=1917215 RepID=UPI0031200023